MVSLCKRDTGSGGKGWCEEQIFQMVYPYGIVRDIKEGLDSETGVNVWDTCSLRSLWILNALVFVPKTCSNPNFP